MLPKLKMLVVVAGFMSLVFTTKAATIGESLMIVKTTNQVVSASTTLVDDTAMTQFLQPNSIYSYQLYVPFSLSGILSGYKFSVSGPGTPVLSSYNIMVVSSGAVVSALPAVLGTAFAGGVGISGGLTCYVNGTIITGSTGGYMTLQFAQSVAAGTITVLAGASTQVWKVQ